MARRAVASMIALIAAAAASIAISSSASAVVAATTKCHAKRSDAEAKEMARTAQTAAETIATEYESSYTHVTPAALHALLPEAGYLPTSRRAATRAHEHAYLLSASGTADAYVVATRAFDGNTYLIRRDNVEIRMTAMLCGRRIRW